MSGSKALGADTPGAEETRPLADRWCSAALHVVMQESYREVGHRLEAPGAPEDIAEHIDWDATMLLRRRADAHGFSIAEAMDTAQRFFLGWENACELITRCGVLELKHGFIAGAGVDHLGTIRSLNELIDGVLHQAHFIQEQGGVVILLPLLFLPESGSSEEDYVTVYTTLLDELEGPVFLHWLGPMFHPGMSGYFPGNSLDRILKHNPETLRGMKLSMLDDDLELRLRRDLLARDQIMLTGDDMHFAELIAGSQSDSVASKPRETEIAGRRVALGDFSHALLGAFDALLLPVEQALRALAVGDLSSYRQIMEPAQTLSRHVFSVPTQHYKAGLAFHSFLAGWQGNDLLVNHEQLARDELHYRELFRLALAAASFPDEALARERFLARYPDGLSEGSPTA